MSDKEKILKLLHSIIIRTNIVSIGRQANNPDNIDLCFKRDNSFRLVLFCGRNRGYVNI